MPRKYNCPHTTSPGVCHHAVHVRYCALATAECNTVSSFPDDFTRVMPVACHRCLCGMLMRIPAEAPPDDRHAHGGWLPLRGVCTSCLHRMEERAFWGGGGGKDAIARWHALESRSVESPVPPRQVSPPVLRPLTPQEILRQRLQDIPERCVYVVQLVAHTNTVKIGYSAAFAGRRLGLRSDYGPLRYVLALPHEHPQQLERELHRRFAAMRLYRGSSPSELFQFNTKRQQRLLMRFLAEHPTGCIESVVWTETAPGVSSDSGQGVLFPASIAP